MGSGVSKGEEVVDDADYAQHVKSEAAFTNGENSGTQISQRPKSQRSHEGDKHSQGERHGPRISRVEGYEAKVIQITKDGFTPSDVTIMEGQLVTFLWDETCSPVMSVFQVVYDGEALKPVVGGFTGSPTDHNREHEQLFTLEGEYKFAINKIRCTPLTVTVTARTDLHGDVTDAGFVPAIIHIDQGHSINWSWKACSIPHTVNEVTYVMDKGCFRRQLSKNQTVVATVTGKHRQQFKTPGTYYFRTESSELGKYHLCIVYVRTASREHRIEVLDRTFSPMILLIEAGDRVWWSWDKNKCQKLHHIYQIDTPGEDHKEDAPYEQMINGFKWHHNPSYQGLMCHQFREAGVYYFSDQNYDEAAYYIGTVIVKPKPREHLVDIKGKVFTPDVLYAQTGDCVVWKWSGEAVAKAGENILILEEDKLLNPESQAALVVPPDEKLLQAIDEDAVQLMTKSGHATASFTNIGLYTYRISDANDGGNSCSVIVNPGPKNHTIHLTDTGLEPKVIKIRPNDRVWWVWQSGKKQHNIRQVSHEGTPIKNGFSSGLPRDSPSAFQHQFLSPGVFYFESQGLPKLYGAIFVHTQSQVHIATVGREIKPDPVTVQLFDIICWVFKQSVRHGIVEVPSVDKIVDATFSDVPLFARRCIGQVVKNLGLTHYYSKSFQREGKNKNMQEETKLSSAVCDERSDFTVIKVTSQRGFHPKEILLQTGKSVMWTWRGSSEQHNIIHVRLTDTKSNVPPSPIKGPKAFNSGKPVDNNCFVYTFDQPGDYPVVSYGAPGYSCIVHIRDEVTQTSEPYNSSEKKSGTVERYHRIDLDSATDGADIYYTTDGSLPGPHHYTTKHYSKEKGVILKEPGLHFVRAIAIKTGQVHSHVFTSRRYWVLSGEKDNDISADEDTKSLLEEDRQELSPWWSCRPHIKACFTGPGTINIFWDLPEAEVAREQIKGYEVFLNGVSYCKMFPHNSLCIQGLAGGRDYRIVVHVYPKDAQNVEIESNSLNLTCPTETDTGGPLISLEKSEKPDSLSIIWMSIDKPETTVSGYLVFINDQQCGSKLVPDPESSRCKVVVSSCDLNTRYKIHVQALLANSNEIRTSNVLEVFLPMDTSQFKYPPDMEKQDDKDQFLEYIQVTEGPGFLSDMDDPDNPIWETETDSGSDATMEEGSKKKRRRKKKTKIIGIPQPTVNLEHDSGCVPLSSTNQCLTSFPSLEAYASTLLERRSCVGLKAIRSKLSFYTAARVVGRLYCILKILRTVSGSSGYDDNEYEVSQWEEVTPMRHPRRIIRSTMEKRTAHFGMKAPGGYYVGGKNVVIPNENVKTHGILQTSRKREPWDSTKERMSMGSNSSYSLNAYKRRMAEGRNFDQDILKRKDSYRSQAYDGMLGSYTSRASDSQDQIYGEDTEFSDQSYTGISTFDSVMHDRLLTSQSESRLPIDRDLAGHEQRYDTLSYRTGNRNLLKQVRFSDMVPQAVRYQRHPLNSDSTFSDNDASVEHLYRAPQHVQSNVAASFDPSERSTAENSWRSKRRQDEYFEEFGSDYSNYCNSREEIIDKPNNYSRDNHKLQRLKRLPRLVASVDDPVNVVQESYRNMPLFRQQSDPLPLRLPQEEGRMLERYLGYFYAGMEEIPVVIPESAPISLNEIRQMKEVKTMSEARHITKNVSEYRLAKTVSESTKVAQTVSEPRQMAVTVEVEQDETNPAPPVNGILVGKDASLENSSDKDQELDKQRLHYDATKDEVTSIGDNNIQGKYDNLETEGPLGRVGSRVNGPVIIEVEKAMVSDNIDVTNGDKINQEVTKEKTVMIQVGEGEYISGGNDDLLAAPSIMAESRGKDGMMVAWKMDGLTDSEYKLQLFVVNVVGSKFAGDISSDISFECKIADKDKQVLGVQHCWNIQYDPNKSQHQCQVKGLLPEVTYRVYAVANYVMIKGNKPCEVQTTSAVLYYTIQGPPKCPTLWISKVDLYSACMQWDGPALDNGLRLKGYLIFVNGKPLGGIRSPDVKEMVLESLIPGKTVSVFIKAVSEFAEQESQPTRTIHITCPARPLAPVICQEPSFKQGCVLISWNKPVGQAYSSNREAISHYSIYIDDKWHGEVRANKLSDQKGYQYYLTDLLSELGYDISVKAVAGERTIDPNGQHVYCLSESPESNIVPVMAPAAPRSPKVRLEGLHPDGIDVTWQVPQQCGDAVISGYQMLRDGKLYGSVIPPDVTNLHIRDVTLGDRIELQLIALTEHAVGKADSKVDTDKDSGKGSSQPGDKAESSPSHKKHTSSFGTCLIEFKGMEDVIDYSDWPTVLKDVYAGERYTGCKPGPKLVVHYTGLVSAPSEVWCEKVSGHSALIVWKTTSESKAHFQQPDSYQVTWWPGDSPQEDIQSDSTTDDHLLITGLRPSTMYTVVVEARKIEKYKDYDEAASATETPDGLNAFILSSKSKQLPVKTASIPDPPSNVGVIAMTCHSLKVGWDPPKEHGSEIIGIRVECISLDPQKNHHVAVDTLPDCTVTEVPGLHEKTEYSVIVIAVTEEYFDRLPEKHPCKQHHGFPQDMLASQEQSHWLPSSSILTMTSGTEPPINIQIIKSTTTSLTFNWTPPLVYGSNKLTGQIVRWSDVKSSRHAGHEELQIASHVNLIPTEDTVTIDDLSPGAQYKVTIEAVVSVKTTLEPDSWDGSNIERYRRTTHVTSKPFYARTRAPIEPPKVIVMSYTQNTAVLYWEKPPLMSVTGKDDEGKPRYLRRYLQGYKLEINGKLQCCVGPDVNSCTLTKCKPGRTYNVVLVAMTCTEDGKKAWKQKLKSYHTSVDSKEVDYMTLLQDDEHLDESPSETVKVTLPKDQDGYLKTLEAKYQLKSSRDSKTSGDIELTWTVQGKPDLLKQFNIFWYSMDDRVIQTKYVGPEQRRATVPVSRTKTVYTIKVEPSYHTDVLQQHAQEVQVMVPGAPDPPEIFLKSVDLDEFCIEWGEPRLYGGVNVKGYQVYLNDKKAGSELNASHNKATIPCRPSRTYRVNVVALSDTADYGDSQKSNTLVVSPSGHSSVSTAIDDQASEDSGIPIKVTQVTESGIHLDWAGFIETEEVAYYKIQWCSVAQPEQREVKLSAKDFSCVINKCLPGTTHFVRLVAYSVHGQILEKSKQLTVQTSAPPDAPQLSLRASNFHYISVQWEKPSTYGDALITGYKVYVNGVVEAVLNTDQLSYTYTQGKPCQEYAFQVQAMTTEDQMNSKPSEPLVITWPGSRAPAIKCLPSVNSSTLRVGWDDPYLTDGLKIKHFMLVCKEESTNKILQTIGPLHAEAREGEFKNLKKGNYSIYLEIYVYGSDSVIRSELMSMQPALSPDPPQITVTLVGLEERRQVEKFTCDLVNKRDRLIRQVGHKLKKIGALTHPLRAEKNEEVVNGAHYLTRIEELLEDCFSVLENYTGQLTAHVSWQCPQSDPGTHLAGFKLLVDGKEYGSLMHAGIRTVRLQLGLEQPSYRLSMVAVSEKPQGVSGESNVVEVLSMPFKSFTFYCYHTIHRKNVKYPTFGCCKFQDSIQYERQYAKKLANQGLLQKEVSPPACSLLDVFDGEFKPLMSSHSTHRPLVIFFWTPWCLSSQKMMDHFIRFAKDNTREMTYMAVACSLPGGATAESRKSLAHTITANSWREDYAVWHTTSDCVTSVYESKNNTSRTNSGLKTEQDTLRQKHMDLTEVLGIAGVPTLLFVNLEGHIAWHGRYCAYDYPAFEVFMRHTFTEVLRQPCPVSSCDCCKSDTTVDEDTISRYVTDMASSQHPCTTLRPLVPYNNWSPRSLKYKSVNGSMDNITATERMFTTKKQKPGSPKRRVRYSLSVNRRPYSASSMTSRLDRSPYTNCVAPHLHRPHRIRPRPMSARHYNTTHTDT